MHSNVRVTVSGDGALEHAIRVHASARGLAVEAHVQGVGFAHSQPGPWVLVVLPSQMSPSDEMKDAEESAAVVCSVLEQVMSDIGSALATRPQPSGIVLVGPPGDPAAHSPLVAALDFAIDGLASAVRAETAGQVVLVTHLRPGAAAPDEVAKAVGLIAARDLVAEALSLSVVSSAG